MREFWLEIEEAPRYAVSSWGRVKNVITGRVLRPGLVGAGYLNVIIAANDGERLSRKVHRLVAKAFYEEVEPSLEVNHIDGDKLNNAVWNLEWATRSQNIRHAYREKLFRNRQGGLIRVLETGQLFETLDECAEALGYHRSSIGLCLKGLRRSIGGYTFERVT